MPHRCPGCPLDPYNLLIGSINPWQGYNSIHLFRPAYKIVHPFAAPLRSVCTGTSCVSFTSKDYNPRQDITPITSSCFDGENRRTAFLEIPCCLAAYPLATCSVLSTDRRCE